MFYIAINFLITSMQSISRSYKIVVKNFPADISDRSRYYALKWGLLGTETQKCDSPDSSGIPRGTIPFGSSLVIMLATLLDHILYYINSKTFHLK